MRAKRSYSKWVDEWMKTDKMEQKVKENVNDDYIRNSYQ